MALTIPINLNIENIAELNAQVAKLAGAAGGAGAGGAGRGVGAIGGLFGGAGGAGDATAKGLGQIAKQLPGVGMMGDMVGAFKQGGIIGVGMAGVAGILGFVKQIVESSKVFQGIAGSFFKIFGAMADMFLLPFLPLAMRGMQMLMQHLPRFQEWGQKAADWLEGVFKFFSDHGFKDGLLIIWNNAVTWLDTKLPGVISAAVQLGYELFKKGVQGAGGVALDYLNPVRRDDKGDIDVTESIERALFGRKGNTIRNLWEKGPGRGFGGNEQEESGQGKQFSPVVKRQDQIGAIGDIEGGVGSIMNSMEVSLASQAEKVKNYAAEFQQKEVGSGGVLATWDDAVLRGAIPETWDTISGMYQKMEDELEDEARNAKLLSSQAITADLGDVGGGINEQLAKLADEVGAVLSGMTLSDFVLDSSVANEIENCFIIANQCINTKWTSIADLVEGGVEKVQFGVGGQIMDLGAIANLVEQANKMGGTVAETANLIAADVATMVQQMADSSLDLTIDPELLSNRIRDLNTTVESNVTNTANSIIAATDAITALTYSWDSAAAANYMFGFQFGALGAAFGDAASSAWETSQAIMNYKPVVKRRKQVAPVEQIDAQDDVQLPDAGGGAPGGDGSAGGGSTEAALQATAQQDVVASMSAAAAADYMFGFAAPQATTPQETAQQDAVASMSAASAANYMFGFQFGGNGGQRGRSQNVSHSVMNININTRASVQDILSDLKRVQYMDDASFFNSVS